MEEMDSSGLTFSLFNDIYTDDFVRKSISQATKEQTDTITSTWNEKFSGCEQFMKDLVFKFADTSELKMWLITSISSLNINVRTRVQKFLEMAESDRNSSFTQQLLLFACQRIPEQVAKIFLLDKPDLIRDFFCETTSSTAGTDEVMKKRIGAWFTFKFSGKNTGGALALEQYLFMNRDKLWKKLVWQGKRSIPPPVAIQKKNLLMELDVVKTLNMLTQDQEEQRTKKKDNNNNSDNENDKAKDPDSSSESDEDYGTDIRELRREERRRRKYLEGNLKGFWESDFFRESLESGEVVDLDVRFFADTLFAFYNGRMQDKYQAKSSEYTRQIERIIAAYVEKESFSVLCTKLLMSLTNEQLLNFIYRLDSLDLQNFDQRQQSYTLEQAVNTIILCQTRWTDLQEAILFNALLNYGRLLIRFIGEDKTAENKFYTWLDNNFPLHSSDEEAQSNEIMFWIYRKHLASLSYLDQVKFAVTQSFAINSRLMRTFNDSSSLEKIMNQQRIAYRRIESGNSEHPKKRKRSKEDDEETEVLGWRLEGCSSVFSLNDVCTYLAHRFVLTFMGWLARHKK